MVLFIENHTNIRAERQQHKPLTPDKVHHGGNLWLWQTLIFQRHSLISAIPLHFPKKAVFLWHQPLTDCRVIVAVMINQPPLIWCLFIRAHKKYLSLVSHSSLKFSKLTSLANGNITTMTYFHFKTQQSNTWHTPWVLRGSWKADYICHDHKWGRLCPPGHISIQIRSLRHKTKKNLKFTFELPNNLFSFY